MKALKAALEELNVIDPFDALATDIGSLGELAQYAEDNSGGFADISMESMFQSFKEKNYLAFGHAAKHQFAIEEISAGVWALIVAAAVAIIAMLKKFYDWAFGSGSSSGGGHVSFVARNLHDNKTTVATSLSTSEELNKEIAHASPQVEKKRITTMDGVVDLYPKDAQDQTPAFTFLKERNGVMEDILTGGPFSKMVMSISKDFESGPLQKSNLMNLEESFGKILAKEDPTPEEMTRLREAMGKFDNVLNVPGVVHDEHGDQANELRKLVSELAGKTFNSKRTMAEVHTELTKIMTGADIDYIAKVSGKIDEYLKTFTKQYEHLRIEAQTRETKSKENGTSDAMAELIRQTLKDLTKIMKMILEMTRALYTYMKAVLDITKHIQTLGRLALRILAKDVYPKITDEAAKERVKTLAATLKENYAAYKV